MSIVNVTLSYKMRSFETLQNWYEISKTHFIEQITDFTVTVLQVRILKLTSLKHLGPSDFHEMSKSVLFRISERINLQSY